MQHTYHRLSAALPCSLLSWLSITANAACACPIYEYGPLEALPILLLSGSNHPAVWKYVALLQFVLTIGLMFICVRRDRLGLWSSRICSALIAAGFLLILISGYNSILASRAPVTLLLTIGGVIAASAAATSSRLTKTRVPLHLWVLLVILASGFALEYKLLDRYSVAGGWDQYLGRSFTSIEVKDRWQVSMESEPLVPDWPPIIKANADFQHWCRIHGIDRNHFKAVPAVGAGVREYTVHWDKGNYVFLYVAPFEDGFAPFHSIMKKSWEQPGEDDLETAKSYYRTTLKMLDRYEALRWTLDD